MRGTSQKKQPNFLFIMTDQHRADWLGCYGHPLVKTPNLDALAKRGTKFTDFHTASPVCMPNRASFMTGRYPSMHGLRYNGCTLSTRANTFVDVLRQSGYKTASIGKVHLQPFTDIDTRYKPLFKQGPIKDAWKPDTDSYINEEPSSYAGQGRFKVPCPYYGFDYVDMVSGHGDKAGGHYQQWFREKHANWRELNDPKNELPHNYTCPQAFRTPVPEDSYPTAYIRDRAKTYLQQHAGSNTPKFTFVSFADPHHPFNPPGKYWHMYSPDDFEIPSKATDHKNPPPPLQHAMQQAESGTYPELWTTVFLAQDIHIKQAMALTAGMITMIDDAVGEIIQTLKDTGEYENTVIIFNADHGDYLGDFNLLLKGAWAKESISRVPFIWHDPTQDTLSTVDVLASTVDLAPTILDRAGINPYFGMSGISLCDAMHTNTPVRDTMLVEYNDNTPRMGFAVPSRVRTLISKQWHFTVYKNQSWGELYNRQTDPKHWHNVWDDTAHQDVKHDYMWALNNTLIDLMDESPKAIRIA